MRIAATEPHARHASVFLDGEYLSRCVEACEEERWADVIATDANGAPIHNGDAFEIKRLHGLVEINLPWRHPA